MDLVPRYQELSVLQAISSLFWSIPTLVPAGVLLLIAGRLRNMFWANGGISCVQRAITTVRSALVLCPQGHILRAASLNDLALCLELRFDELGLISDLQEAITLHREALQLHSPGHRFRHTSLNNIASCLFTRFNQTGAIADLEEAIAFHREALKLCPQDPVKRHRSLTSLAISVSTRFGQLGVISDLEEAIMLHREALQLHPQGHLLRLVSLINVADGLFHRFDQLGVMADLEEAITLNREALQVCPPGHYLRSSSVNNLAGCLSHRFKQLKVVSDLEEAIMFNREALQLRSQGHPLRSESLNNLANCFSERFERLGEMSDLEEAITFHQEALRLRLTGHPLRPMSLNNLASCLFVRFSQLGAVSDLEDTIAFRREALGLCPQGHPLRSSSLDELASSLSLRFSQFGEISDVEEVFTLYTTLSDMPQTVSFRDVHATKEWVRAAEQHMHGTTVLAYRTSLGSLASYLATLPSLPQHLSVLKNLISSLAVDAFSACLRHGALTESVELLEQGRGVFWNQLARIRSPIDDVIAAGDTNKELAEKFKWLTGLLRHVLDSTSNPRHNQSSGPTSQHDWAWHLNVQLQDVLFEIRRLPGHSRFLLPPLFSDLRKAADGGPVIIVNASQYGCDALVVLSDQDPIHVPLSIGKDDVQRLSSQLSAVTASVRWNDVTRELVVILRELWTGVVSPIVDVLQEVQPPPSRIWWCPTAEFSLLPLHAAGSYGKMKPKNLSDLYISSYTPTLTALVRARQPHPSNLKQSQPHFLAVGQAQAPGENVLACVTVELDDIQRIVSPLTTFKHLEGDDAKIAKVSEELKKSEFVHLACHGIPDRKKPFESAFALGNGPLKIEDIMRYHMHNPRFAYLSACHTTVGDEESPDEVIHLAAVMQFAGFRSVIGTMWAVDDAYTNQITSRFYENMVGESGCLDHDRAAFALHKTLKTVKMPFDQRILFIHIGA